jgi:hypothetical protein
MVIVTFRNPPRRPRSGFATTLFFMSSYFAGVQLIEQPLQHYRLVIFVELLQFASGQFTVIAAADPDCGMIRG